MLHLQLKIKSNSCGILIEYHSIPRSSPLPLSTSVVCIKRGIMQKNNKFDQACRQEEKKEEVR